MNDLNQIREIAAETRDPHTGNQAQAAVHGGNWQRLRFERYHEMRLLLAEIADNTQETDPRQFLDRIQGRARVILNAMGRERSPQDRLVERARELEELASIYRAIFESNLLPHAALAVAFEAIKAWERSHPPAPLDPLLS